MSSFASKGDESLVDDDFVTCLTLHPVSWPSHGAAIELSLASEALGLVRSLDWEIREGPNIKNENEDEEGAVSGDERDEDTGSGRTSPTIISPSENAR